MYFPQQFFYIVSLHSFAGGEVGWVTVHVYDEIKIKLRKGCFPPLSGRNKLVCRNCQSPTTHCRRMQSSALQRTYLEPSLRLWGVLCVRLVVID